RANDASSSGSASASHGRRRRFPVTPAPYAMPKCRNDAGDTTSTSTPRARNRSTASATKRPAGSTGERGYEVVRTATLTSRRRAVRRHRRENRPTCRHVLEDLARNDAGAAAARLRRDQQQRLGVALQLERPPARDERDRLDAVAEPERLRELPVGGAKAADEADDDVLETRLGERAQERLRIALAEEGAGVRDAEPLARRVR